MANLTEKSRYALTILEETSQLPVLYLDKQCGVHNFIFRNSIGKPRSVLVKDNDIIGLQEKKITARKSSGIIEWGCWWRNG